MRAEVRRSAAPSPGAAEPVRDLRDVGEAERVEPVERLDRQRAAAGRRSRPASPATSPGRPRAAASTFAGSAAERELVEVLRPSAAPSRPSPRPSPRRPRPARGAPSRAPAPPRAGRGQALAQSMIPMTAAKLSCQPTSPSARGLIARVTPAASSTAYQRERGRSGERRDQPGRAHDAGALDRGAGAGDRHVDGDQGSRRRPAAPAAAGRAAPAAARRARRAG